MNEVGKNLVARMARREAAARRSELTTLYAVEDAYQAAFESACNADQQMADLRRSEAARAYFETVFFNQFSDLY
jgi:hypothetical protein